MNRTQRDAQLSRRNFLKTAAGASAGAMLIRQPLWAAGAPASRVSAIARINQPFMQTPKTFLEWNTFKAQGGPTYAGSVGWKRYTDFLLSKMPQFGAVD